MRRMGARLEAMERKKHSYNSDDSDEEDEYVRKKKKILMKLKSLRC